MTTRLLLVLLVLLWAAGKTRLLWPAIYTVRSFSYCFPVQQVGLVFVVTRPAKTIWWYRCRVSWQIRNRLLITTHSYTSSHTNSLGPVAHARYGQGEEMHFFCVCSTRVGFSFSLIMYVHSFTPAWGEHSWNCLSYVCSSNAQKVTMLCKGKGIFPPCGRLCETKW